jgi:hypothetical protein
MQERRRLRVPKVGEGLPLRDGGSSSAEGASPLGFLDAGADDRNARGGDGDGRVDKRRIVGDAKVVKDMIWRIMLDGRITFTPVRFTER